VNKKIFKIVFQTFCYVFELVNEDKHEINDLIIPILIFAESSI
jgi:hypothetical protein